MNVGSRNIHRGEQRVHVTYHVARPADIKTIAGWRVKKSFEETRVDMAVNFVGFCRRTPAVDGYTPFSKNCA